MNKFIENEIQAIKTLHREGWSNIKKVWNLALYLRENAPAPRPSLAFSFWVAYWVVITGPVMPQMGSNIIR